MDDKQSADIIHSEDATVLGAASEDPRPWYKQPELRKLYFMMPFLFLGSTTLGYDGSLLNGLQTMPAWKECTYSPKFSNTATLQNSPLNGLNHSE